MACAMQRNHSKQIHPFPFLHSPSDPSARQHLLQCTVPKLGVCSIAEVERELILGTLRCYNGSRTTSANVLGISIRTIRNKIHECEQLGIAVPVAASKPTPGDATSSAIAGEL